MSERKNLSSGLRPTDNKQGILVRIYLRDRTFTKTLKIPPTQENLEYAETLRKEWMHKINNGMDPFFSVVGESTEDVGYSAFSRMFIAARKRKHGYHLSRSDEEWLVRRCAGRCEVTGVRLSVEKGQSDKAPFSPSLDRIDSSKGYCASNVRIVCTAANFAMNEWGESVLSAIAFGYTEKAQRQLKVSKAG